MRATALLMIGFSCTPLLAAAAAAQQAPRVHPAEVQIASATAALPEEFRAGATVLGYDGRSPGLVPLREGKGAFICLADDPAEERFHVACYHESLEPFMARGRELRAQGIKGAGVDSVRYAEIESGKLPMPRHPAALFSLTGKPTDLDAATGAVTGARPLYVVYVAFATAESTGLPTRAAPGQPWIMLPGTPKAHIMFVPTM